MPFINRNAESKIAGLFSCKQYEGQEYLEEDNQEFLDHLTKQKSDEDERQATEALIQAKMREQAITALVAEGKIEGTVETLDLTDLKAATTIAGLKAALVKILEGK